MHLLPSIDVLTQRGVSPEAARQWLHLQDRAAFAEHLFHDRAGTPWRVRDYQRGSLNSQAARKVHCDGRDVGKTTEIEAIAAAVDGGVEGVERGVDRSRPGLEIGAGGRRGLQGAAGAQGEGQGPLDRQAPARRGVAFAGGSVDRGGAFAFEGHRSLVARSPASGKALSC